MTEDARFEDGAELPLRLKAEDAEDVPVLAALIQDSVLPASEMRFERKQRRFVCLLNRFRWEDKDAASRMGRGAERVQSLLSIQDADRVAHQGLTQGDADTVLSLLTLAFEPGEDGSGRMILTFAGDGAVAVEVEAINITLQDVTRPYLAPSGKAPEHPE